MPAPKNPLHHDQPDPADRPATGPTPSPTPEPPSTTEADRAAAPPSDRATDSDARRPRTFEPSRLGLLIVAVLVGSALFVGGFTLGARVATTPGTPASQEAQFDPFWDVYSLIQNEYAGSPKPSTDQLVQAAINGMMQSLNDPWSYYQAPSDFESSLLSVGGQAQGIGVEVQLQPIDPNSGTSCSAIGNGCELAVVQPICGSPAAAAGIQAGDVIVSVGGTALDGLTIDQATAMIKGPNDTSVTLGLLRGTHDHPAFGRAHDLQPVRGRLKDAGQRRRRLHIASAASTIPPPRSSTWRSRMLSRQDSAASSSTSAATAAAMSRTR